MELLQQLQTQVIAIWKRWNASQRIGFAVAALLCLIGIGLVSSWATQQEYAPLLNNLSAEEAHGVISALQNEGIESKTNFSGSTVLVPVGQMAQAKMATRDYGSAAAAADEGGGGGLWEDPAQQKSAAQRAQEKRLAASIAQLKSVKAATIHISQSDSSPFLRERKPAKASIMLELIPGAMFTASDAQGIISLVSHSVQNLSPENTIIVDTSGRTLSSSNQGMADVTGQMAYRRQLEIDLAQKAEAMLVPILGPQKAVVRITADVDFTERKTDTEKYDPDTKVKKKEIITSESSTGEAVASGGAGTASNVGGLSMNDSGGGTSKKSETIETDYENTKIVDTVREVGGTIRRISVAAIVELPQPTTEDGETAASQVPVVTIEQIQRLIQQAVGFDENREDEIEVVASQFMGLPELDAPVGFGGMSSDLESLLRSASLGIAAIVALIIGWMTVKKLKPVVVEVDRRKSLSPEVRERLANLAEEIRERPDAMSTVLTSWMQDGTENVDDKKARKVA